VESASLWDGAVVLGQLTLGLLVLDTLRVLRRGWRLKSRGDYLGVLAVACAFFLLGLGVIACWASAEVRKSYAGLIGAALLVLLAVVVVETLLRLWPQGRARVEAFHRKPPWLRFGMRFAPGELPGVSPEARFTVNSLGLRGPEPPPRDAAYRILCLGGSTTECMHLDDERTWPHLLMANLHARGTGAVWIGNAGESGYYTKHQLRFVRQSALMGHVDCLVILAGVINFFQGTAPPPPPGIGRGRRRPLWRDSGLFRLCADSYRAWRARSDDQRGWLSVSLDKLRRPRRESPILDELPRLAQGLITFRERVREIARVCARRGVRLVFATQPVLWHRHLSRQAEALLWCGLPDGTFRSPGKLRQGMDLFNAALAEECAARGVECIDLSSLSGQEQLFYDDCHVNEKGAAEVARRIAEWLALPAPTPTVDTTLRRSGSVHSWSTAVVTLTQSVVVHSAALALGLLGALCLGPVPDPLALDRRNRPCSKKSS
jgi:hypothetical protein